MALRQICKRGDEVLSQKSKPVLEINDKIRELVQDMKETMANDDGVGLAAPQIGILRRLFVCTPYVPESDEALVFINPEIISQEGSQESWEGCLSVPGYFGKVNRPMSVKVKAQDLDGKLREYEFSGFAATVFCHENDHLDGILYTDKTNELLTQEQYYELFSQANETE